MEKQGLNSLLINMRWMTKGNTANTEDIFNILRKHDMLITESFVVICKLKIR